MNACFSDSIKRDLPEPRAPTMAAIKGSCSRVEAAAGSVDAAGQPAILIGPDRQPAAHQLDEVHAKAVHIGLVEPAQDVLLHVLPGGLDQQLPRTQPGQAREGAEDRQKPWNKDRWPWKYNR